MFRCERFKDLNIVAHVYAGSCYVDLFVFLCCTEPALILNALGHIVEGPFMTSFIIYYLKMIAHLWNMKLCSRLWLHL
jgi:hypothetical protein